MGCTQNYINFTFSVQVEKNGHYTKVMEKGTTYLMKEFTGQKNLTQHGLDPVEVKFIYSEKATIFYEIFTLLLTGLN